MADLTKIVKKEDYIVEEGCYCFISTPVWKTVFLSLVTCGIYELVLFYKYWKTLKTDFGYNVSPFWRAVFAPITGFWLFSIIAKYVKAHNMPAFPAILFAILYFILNNIYKVPDPYWLVGFATVIIIGVVQDKINKVNEIYYPNAVQNPWTTTNTLWAIPCTIIFVLAIIGTFLPD